MARTNPDWTTSTQKYLESHSDTFGSDLKKISMSLARHDKADSVSRSHIDRAYQTIVWHGLSRRKIYKRPEFMVTLAGIAFGGAGFYSDVADFYFGEGIANQYGWIVVTSLIVLASVLLACGWLFSWFGSEHT